ncbi:hypothetical protein C0995_014923 [Termitomyces sp. Mi166|nr:hypothetical protein C0995_014923 [Termitomyces sp. Mi166\
MQVAQDAQTKDQLVIAPKVVHKTASENDTSDNNFEKRGLEEYFYCFPHTNTMFIEAAANKAASYEYKTEKAAKQPNTVVYKYAMRGFPLNLIELKQLFKHVTNLHVPTHDQIVGFMLFLEFWHFATNRCYFKG